jgi:hypothetical protein
MTSRTPKTVRIPARPPSAEVIGSATCDFCGQPATHVVVRIQFEVRWNACAECIAQRRMHQGAIYLTSPKVPAQRPPIGSAPDPDSVPCARCGCMGNSSCGHEPLDMDKCCTLDRAELCPCCRVKQNDQAQQTAQTTPDKRP